MEGILQNTWYMAGWEHELAPGKLARRIADIPVVVFRSESGKLGAVLDRCPHRFAPLSMGTVEGENLVCPYHGLGFNTQGKCVVNPFSEKIPAGSTIRHFKVVAKDTIVWLWLGDQEKADEALIPDYAFLNDTSANRVVRDYIHMASHYEYITDNLMDASHIEWCHRNSFGGNGLVQLGQHAVVPEGEALWINWSFPDVPQQPIPIYETIPWERVDMWIDTRWSAPASVVMKIGETPVGAPREQGLEQLLAHIVTPETATTSHYFWGVARGIKLDSVDEDKRLYGMLRGAFEDEDGPVIEAAQRAVGTENFWDLKPVHLGPDIGSTRVRRMLETMIRKEQDAAAAATV
ncbi:vanillate O-demethylase monooxygenase subunit [Paraburkholderia unamae]|uniref:aromatic ring-hydroxylating dioxygenase subunit alpha n=1 Tax=Paraburkholderia unamae TaxID=219649 RepID=UPI000DC47E31|nr:aromatic ring-hydroxylating dioxygenase subunit alpha [Paraburkholderia unamae]RAR66095.1 vanillate O-demethylase monooxygenase subunit [Paraburkholderia unamae]